MDAGKERAGIESKRFRTVCRETNTLCFPMHLRKVFIRAMNEPHDTNTCSNGRLLLWGINVKSFNESRVIVEGVSLFETAGLQENATNYSGDAWLTDRDNKKAQLDVALSSFLVDGSRWETWMCSRSVEKYGTPWLLADLALYSIVYIGRIQFEVDHACSCSRNLPTFSNTPVWGNGWFGLMTRKWQRGVSLRRREIWSLIAFSSDSLLKLSSGAIYGETIDDKITLGYYSIPNQSS